MRAVFGLLLIMLGLAMAVVWMPEQQTERQLAVVTEIATKVTPTTRNAETSEERSGRSFSPRTPLIAALPAQSAQSQPIHASPEAVRLQMQPGWQAASALVPPPVQSALTGLPTPAATMVVQPSDAAGRAAVPEMSRDDLVRNIQRELKRVGCYWGDVDGDWGMGSRRAMASFTERVNASLPIDQPDFILLTLLRAHAGTACGKGCPAGQVVNDHGRCIVPAVTARRPTERRPSGQPHEIREEPATTTASAVSTVPAAPLAVVAAASVASTARTPQPPLPGRMSIGGPSVPAAVTVQPPPASPARDAVREPDDRTTASRSTARDRSRRQIRRTVVARGYPVPSAPIYRGPPPPRYYAPPVRRTASRSWTATFFSNQP